MKIVLVSLGMLLLTASMATAAPSDREKFQKLVGKAARLGLAKSRTACLCVSGEYAQRAGRMWHTLVNDQVAIQCSIPTFDGQGSESYTEPCFDFVPLSR